MLAIETKQQQRAAERSRDSYAKDLQVNTAFYKVGAATKQDVAITKSNLAQAEDNLEQSKKANLEALRSLEILLGQYPTGKYQVADIMPREPAPIQAGIPANILEQRPESYCC